MSYSRRGSGRPVVLLHGWCLSSSVWTYAEEALTATHEVIVPDLAGFGRSDGLAGPYSLDRYAADVSELLETAQLQDAVLVGFAFGAAVAVAAAGLDDSRISQVISVAMPDPEASPYDRMPKSMRRDWPDFARRSAEALFLKTKSAATIGWLERIFASAHLTVAIEVCGLLQRLDAPALAAAAKVPQLFIHSTTDAVAPVAFGQRCADAAPQGELAIIEGAGHLLILDDKVAFHEMLIARL